MHGRGRLLDRFHPKAILLYSMMIAGALTAVIARVYNARSNPRVGKPAPVASDCFAFGSQ
jgi:hypothetical protein